MKMTTRRYYDYKENANDYREDIQERKDADERQSRDDDDKMEIVLLATVRPTREAQTTNRRHRNNSNSKDDTI